MHKNKITPYLYMLPGLAILLFFVYIPVIMNIGYSFFSLSSYSADQHFVGLENYRRLFQSNVFPIMLKNNILYAVISLIVQVGFGTLIALFLESKLIRPKFGNFCRNLYDLPALISLTAVGLMFTFIYEPSVGFLNAVLRIFHSNGFAWLGDSKLAIYCIIAMSQWQFTGYITLLMVVAFQNVPQEFMESAAIDGAGLFKRTLYILIPQAKEQLLVCTIITIIGAFKLYTEVYATTAGGPGNSTQVLGLFLYQQAFLHDELGMAAATGVFIFVVTIVLSVLQIKITRSGKD